MIRNEISDPISVIGSNGELVLLIHSFTGTPAQVRPLAATLAEAGYSVVAPLLAGHGTAIEDMAGVRASDWVEDVRRSVAGMERSALHIVGTSMGGLLGIILADELGARSLTLMNTPLRFRNPKTYLAPLVRYVKRIHRWKEGATAPEMPNARYRVQYDGYAMSALASFLRLSLAARGRLSSVPCRTLIIQTKDDSDTHPSSADVIARRITNPERAVLWLDGDDHEVLLSTDSERVIARILENIEGRS